MSTNVSRALRRSAFALMLIAPGLVHAGDYWCDGTIGQVTTGPDGRVNATFAFDSGEMPWQYVCSLNETAGDVTPAACKAILATLLSANLGKKRIKVWFNSANEGQCNAPGWKPLNEMGWYWGPALMP